MRRLNAVEKVLLATLLPVLAVTFALHVESLVTIDLAQPPLWIEPPAASEYPRVGGYLVETGRGGAELERGDRLLRIGARDLQGLGPLRFRAAAMEQAGHSRAVDVVYERDGERRGTRLEFVAPRLPWAKTPAFLIALVTSVLLLRRASNVRFARLFFVSASLLAMSQLAWYGPRHLQTLLYWSYFVFGTALAAPLVLRAAMSFPDDRAISRRTANVLCVAVGLAYLVVRASELVTWLLPPRHVASLILAVDAGYVACILAALTWNYRHTDSRGRRQIRWVTLGAYVALLPLSATLLATALDPDFSWFDELLAVAAVTTVGIPLSFWIAVARTNLFDIDRLIGASASYGIVLLLVVAGLVGVVQGASEPVGRAVGLPGGVAQIALAVAMAAAAIPLGGRLRRRVDAFFFPERRALELGAERLRGRLSACGDPRTLFSLLGAEISAILRPVRCVLYVRSGGAFSPAFASGAEVSEDFAPPDSLQELPLVLDDGATVLAPIRRVSELAAVLALGVKRSGDVYTATDLTLIGSIAERASSELLRFQHEQVVAETERMISGLRREKEAADRASRAKTLFLATASHDLRQPLHALGLFAETLAERPLDDGSRSLVAKIVDLTESLETSFSAILDLSRLEAGALQPELSSFPVDALCDDVEREFRETAARKGLELRIERCPAWVRSDRVLLGRIVQNLVANAVRYTRVGWIALSCKEEGDRVRIEVRDSGVGVPEVRQRAIFREFERGEGAGRSADSGTGLGLSIVSALANLLGHPLDFRSRAGEGSTFGITLPQGARRPPTSAPAVGGVDLRGRLVLVIDDEADIRDGMERLLAGWGCRVLAVASRDEALAALAGETRVPDLVIADYLLGDGDTGLAAIAAVRARSGRSVPALVVTGESDRAALAPLVASGLPVLHKPVAPVRLRAAVTHFLDEV